MLLIIDDEESIRHIVARLVERMGFTSQTVAGGQEALQLLKASNCTPAAVLLDLNMPHMDGETVATAIRQICPDIPLILMSGEDPYDINERFAYLGPAGILQKPFLKEEISRALGAI